MKRIFWIFVSNFIVIGTAFTQGNWELVIPFTPTSNQMVSLHFIDETTGWAVGDYGTIIKTTDGGYTWALTEISQFNDLTDVFFPTQSVGYIVGKDGIILKSADAGKSWLPQTNRFLNNLARARFLDENNGWIIGEKGLILQTTDGGSNWEQQISNCRENLKGLALIGDSRICAVGNDSTILISRNSGETWNRIHFVPRRLGTYQYNDVWFLNASQGWIGGTIMGRTASDYSGILLFTDDGGDSWVQIQPIELDYQCFSFRLNSMNRMVGIQQVLFSEPETGYFLSDDYSLINKNRPENAPNIPFTTTSSGSFWKSRMFGTSDFFERPGRLADLQNGHLICTAFGGEFRHSTDNGATWHYPNELLRDFTEIKIGERGKMIGYQISQYDTMQSNASSWFASDDYGKRWQPFEPQFYDEQRQPIENLQLSTAGTYFKETETLLTTQSINQSKALFESKDFGKTWYAVHSGVNADLFVPTFLTPDTVIQYYLQIVETAPNVKTSEITIGRSFDGGQTLQSDKFQTIWNLIAPYDAFYWFLQVFISDAWFFNGHSGFLVGSEGNIIKTTDTGGSWRVINSGIVEDLYDIIFVNRQTGFVVGEFGRILKTEDGGNTWRKTDSGTQENILSIGFRNENEGWVGTENGLRYTTDGGEHWRAVPLRYFHGPVWNITFDKEGTGYAYTYRFFSNEERGTRSGGYLTLLVLKEGGVVVENLLPGAPNPFNLNQNYPNPFNSTTHIQFFLPEKEPVSLKIYNVRGQLVRTLLDEVRKSGQHEVFWDGMTRTGQLAASGVYFYRLTRAGEVKVRKLLLLK